MGVFGSYTRWAVVFLIIFVLFFLLCPTSGSIGGMPPSHIAVTSYGTAYSSPYTGIYPSGYAGPYMGKTMGSSPAMMSEYGSSPSSL